MNLNFFRGKNKKQKILVALLGIILIFSISTIIIPNLFKKEDDFFVSKEQKDPEKKDECQDCLPSLVDGRLISPEKVKPNLISLVIDNHPKSRPQVGLSQAPLVYEVEVEGGVTRYLAIFTGYQDLEKIGPIRSARPYFIDWSKGLSALFVHCGGSPAALAQLTLDPILNLDEFYKEEHFWRDQSIPRPYNIFTSSELIKDYLNKTDIKNNEFQAWKFKDPELSEKKGQDQIVSINFSSDYQVDWEYKKEKARYLRYINNHPHKDEKEEIVNAQNIVLQYVNSKVLDKDLRLSLDIIGVGQGLVCQKGSCQEVEWRKPDRETRTRYYDLEGEEIVFYPGNTWIEIIRESKREDIEIKN